MNITHPSFPQPVDITEPVWRYLSLGKLVSFFSDKALYLSRSDLLGDSHEGTIPALNAADIRTQFCDPYRPDLIIKARKMWKLFTYVNCWHINHNESEAMWRLYCPRNDGVAIRSTYANLARSVESDSVFMGRVQYIDYRSELMPLDNMFNPIMHKRRAFEHEREVRVVTHLANNIESVEEGFDEAKCIEQNPRGIKVSVDVHRMVDCLYVNPYAPKWHYESVKALLDKFEISIHLEWSRIADDPYH